MNRTDLIELKQIINDARPSAAVLFDNEIDIIGMASNEVIALDRFARDMVVAIDQLIFDKSAPPPKKRATRKPKKVARVTKKKLSNKTS